MLNKNFQKKSDIELVDIHKKVITNWLHLHGAKLRTRKKFFFIYDYYITWKNIRWYYYLPIRIFIVALITDRLDYVKSYYPYKKKKKNGKR